MTISGLGGNPDDANADAVQRIIGSFTQMQQIHTMATRDGEGGPLDLGLARRELGERARQNPGV